MSAMSMLKAAEAGVDMIDTTLSPFAYRTSHPAVEPIVMALIGTNRDTGLDIRHLARIGEVLEKDILPKYRHLLDDSRFSIIDINVLLHQTPGGMLSNLVSQLKEMDALDKLDQVFAELPRVRKELGQIPLVTPTSQIVGIQTVNNVLFDGEGERYKMITAQVKDLCYGLYGRTAVPIDPVLQKKALKDYPRGSEPFTGRPAEILAPELEKAKEAVKDLTADIDDVLIYALYPVTGRRFLECKYGKAKPQAEAGPRPLEEARAVEALVADIRAGKEICRKKPVPSRENLRKFDVYVEDEHFEVFVESEEKAQTSARNVPPKQEAGAGPPRVPAAAASPRPEKGPSPPEAKPGMDGTPVLAPMPGMIVSYEKKAGDRVQGGETVLILEAMKMENALPAPVSGTIKSISFKPGDRVAKNDVLIVIEP
jgi:oxaloacetate decarboxylase alpha subunit/pyruvate carboxylase subunit B